MIGNPKWFNLKKYDGWGLNPKTKKGYIYAAGVGLSIAAPQLITTLDLTTRVTISITLALFWLIDALDIMSKIKLDEREQEHFAKAERNASMTMVMALSFGIIIILFTSILNKTINYEALGIIFITLISGYIAKVRTLHNLEK